MAMKILCTGCKKKISVDEAFAGGACRCPYCKEIVLVPAGEGRAGATAARPVYPTLRPDAPPGREESAPSRAAPAPASPQATMADVISHAEVPMARPVRNQGIMALVLLVVFVLAAVGAFYLWKALNAPVDEDKPDANTQVSTGQDQKTKHPPAGTATTNPKPTAGPNVTPAPNPTPVPKAVVPNVADEPIKISPVIYVLDCGGGMAHEGLLDAARAVALRSVASLKPVQRFTIILAEERDYEALPGDYLQGGAKGVGDANKFLEDARPRGESDIPRALMAALNRLDRADGTIVLCCHKAIDSSNELLEKIKASKAAIIAVAMDGDDDVLKSLQQLVAVAPSHGKVVPLDKGKLNDILGP
jgi:hypothetical protein